MAYSSILGADPAPTQPSGREAELLGPSDLSDSGSDTVGASDAHADSDSSGTGERGAVAGADAIEGGDILPDRIVDLAGAEVRLAQGNGFPEADPDGMEMTDLDAEDAEDAAARDESDARR